MCAKPAHDSHSKRPSQRLRFPRSVPLEKTKDVKVVLDVIIRPSIQLAKLALRRGVLNSIASKRPKRIGDDTSSSSSITSSKKRVRFDERPVTIARRGFFERFRRDSSPPSSPARPCLVVRECDIVRREPPQQSPPETDCLSVYEDCFSDYPGFLADLQILDGDDERCFDTRTPNCIRRSEFYETESGIATFDRTGYANYCLAQWLDKKREEARSSRKLVFKGPALLPRQNRTLSPPPLPASIPSEAVACSLPPLAPTLIRSPTRSLPRRIWKCVEDEFQNAVVVLIIGLLIHTCLFLFLLYDILTRGLIPSDD